MSGSQKRSGRPEAYQSSPDAPETSTQNVSQVSVPPIETRVIPTSFDPPAAGDAVAELYDELLVDPPNPVETRLLRATRQLDETRRQMLELLLAGHGPEASELWARLAAELQAIILDLSHLSAEVACVLQRRRLRGSRPDLSFVSWHAPAVQLCVNHHQCAAAIAAAAREGFDLDGLEVGIDSTRDIARLLRGRRRPAPDD